MNPGDLTRLDTAKQWLGLTGLAVSDITQATPAVVTLAGRPTTPLISGAVYTLDGILGTTELNDTAQVITVISPTTFSIPVDSTLFTAYAGGGYVGVSDPLIARLISACSTFMQSWMNLQIASAAYNETRSGQGMPMMMLQNHPVVSVDSVTINGLPIPARPALAPIVTASQLGGFVFDDFRVMLTGFLFSRGFQNVSFVYRAGYQVTGEPNTIPASAPYTLSGMAHWAASPVSAILADGTQLALVTGLPGPGQYAFADTVFTFNAAEAGIPVALSYGYVPFDLEQACVDMIGDWFRYRDRIGKTSEAIDAQSISFTNTAITARAQGVLNQYRKVAPIQ